MSVLPVDKSTIIYGSCDGGETVVASNSKFNAIMKIVGKQLNLKAHIAGKDNIQIFGPADLEGHQSKEDGCFYLLDLARTMPPQITFKFDSLKHKGNRHLYELLRPELVKNNPVPLSSDGLTGMGRNDPQQSLHNCEIRNACDHLLNHIVPSFATNFEKEIDLDLVTPSLPKLSSVCNARLRHLDPEELVQAIHRQGINIRLLGFVRQKVTLPGVSNLILHEMVSRVLKDEINRRMRETMKNKNGTSNESLRLVVLNYFNEIFTINRTHFWVMEVKMLLKEKFMFGLTVEEEEPSCDLLKDLNVSILMNRFGDLSNIRIDPDAISSLQFGYSIVWMQR
eukprot:TRINITY_DN15980_c0_g1_i2.p1 TRINITY_DN15980_c0_g1~~TRINITY_DN15980_c0_g1_i2.p1  ORF type:complete len:370 (+),score=79.98 TRINITY_DN15980_c0_g1_i2:99-1112(+)